MEDFDKKVIKVVQEYLKNSAFSDRKLTDTPTDGLQVVNRNYVTQNGLTRPSNPVMAQQFWDVSLQKPIYWSGTTWKDSQGNIV